MNRAAELLERQRTGSQTQTAQEAARLRFAQLLAALENKPKSKEGKEGAEQGGGEGGGKSGARQDGNQVLTQLKLLKILQEDLNSRYRTLADADDASAAPQLTEIATEQGKLAELALKLAAAPRRSSRGQSRRSARRAQARRGARPRYRATARSARRLVGTGSSAPAGAAGGTEMRNAKPMARAVSIVATWAIAGLLWGSAAACFAADDKPAQSGPSLDDELLKDLDNDLLEGAGTPKEKPKPAEGKAGAAKKPAEPGQPEAIDDTMPAEDADPLVRVSEAMRTAEELIPQTRTAAHARALQDRVIDDLSRLIEQAESQRSQQKSKGSKSKQQQTKERQQVKQSKPSQGNTGKDSNKPAEDSTNRLSNAQAARPDPEAFRALLKDTWGHLPVRDREQVLQNSPDKFLPQYELMIERYYKRLAEGQRGN